MRRTSVSTPASAIIASLPLQTFETQDEPSTDPQEDQREDHCGEVHHHNHLVSCVRARATGVVPWVGPSPPSIRAMRVKPLTRERPHRSRNDQEPVVIWTGPVPPCSVLGLKEGTVYLHIVYEYPP